MPPHHPSVQMMPGMAGLMPSVAPFMPDTAGRTVVDARPRELLVLQDGDSIDLEANLVRRQFMGRPLAMYGFNGQYPGPLISVSQGATIVVNFTNAIDLPTTVHPFILRGVTLAGVNSVSQPAERRDLAWARLASDLDPALLESMTTVEPLERLPELAEDILAGRIRGRVVIDVRA